jgi:glutamate--cysteine ligase catalytic subunit
MDIQITDFENAALIILLGEICNIINHFDLDFIMPISLIDENMERAHVRDGLINQKFWFKTSNLPSCSTKHTSNILEQTDYLSSHICDAVSDT